MSVIAHLGGALNVALPARSGARGAEAAVAEHPGGQIALSPSPPSGVKGTERSETEQRGGPGGERQTQVAGAVRRTAYEALMARAVAQHPGVEPDARTGDMVNLSAAARSRPMNEAAEGAEPAMEAPAIEAPAVEAPAVEPDDGAATGRSAEAAEVGDGADPAQALDESQLRQVQELQARDREVRTHEQAHKAAGGQYTGGVSYTFQNGPDGRRYAVGGEVGIDLSPVADNPEATIQKMNQVQRAALAPAEPSGADRAVAAEANARKLQAQQEVVAARAEARTETEEGAPSSEEAEVSGDEAAGSAAGVETAPAMAQQTAPNEPPAPVAPAPKAPTASRGFSTLRASATR